MASWCWTHPSTWAGHKRQSLGHMGDGKQQTQSWGAGPWLAAIGVTLTLTPGKAGPGWRPGLSGGHVWTHRLLVSPDLALPPQLGPQACVLFLDARHTCD